MQIKYIINKSIDKKKWDACIGNSSNSLIYAYSFYLDTIAKNWDALVVGDYEIVMPLTWNKKYGIRYLHQPAFTQQLGIFSPLPVDENTMQLFVDFIQSHFQFAEIFLNTACRKTDTSPCTNFILPLDQTYQYTESNYNTSFIKSLKHAKKSLPIYLSTQDYKEVINAHINEYGKRTQHVKKEDYDAFAEICEKAAAKEMLVIRKVISSDNKLLSTALLLKDKNRLYNIMSVVPKESRTAEANYFLYDELIKEFSGQIAILDFEGSDIKGVAAFYKKFGAINKPYFFLRYNNLPWPIKYLKK